jgi:hypothetical protein
MLPDPMTTWQPFAPRGSLPLSTCALNVMIYSLKAAIKKMKHTPSIPMSRNQWDLLERYAEKLGVSRAGLPELQEDIDQPSDSFFRKWEVMLDFFKK